MKFIETPMFTKLLKGILTDDDYKNLQLALLTNPKKGKVIPEGGGLRKIRWKIESKGKRGGVRVIYYWISAEYTFYMITLYKKSYKEDLTKEQLKALVKYVKEYLK
ncbi:MAG: type II toxin-antitoxin system RelE/ParE family toxin [Candidatus Aureabacteria bacterium]|nr:type II toxin-antitoxin system RelE/ParE family toxin [Candidatus Auribacterota bacterium]